MKTFAANASAGWKGLNPSTIDFGINLRNLDIKDNRKYCENWIHF